MRVSLVVFWVMFALMVVSVGSTAVLLWKFTKRTQVELLKAKTDAAEAKGTVDGLRAILAASEKYFNDERDRHRTLMVQKAVRIDNLITQLQLTAERVATMRLNGGDSGDRQFEPPPFMNVDQDVTTPPYSDELQEFMDRIENMEVKDHLEAVVAMRRREGIPDSEILAEIEKGES